MRLHVFRLQPHVPRLQPYVSACSSCASSGCAALPLSAPSWRSDWKAAEPLRTIRFHAGRDVK